MSEWQPIETAPRDGTDILVCSAWIMADGAYRIGWAADGYFDGDCWVFGSFDVDPDEYSAPTFWMPLQTPQKDQTHDQKNGPRLAKLATQPRAEGCWLNQPGCSGNCGSYGCGG